MLACVGQQVVCACMTRQDACCCRCLPCLQAFSEQAVLGDREHILLFLANITLPTTDPDPSGGKSSAIELVSAMLWIGYKPGVRGRSPLLLADAAAAGTISDSGGVYERISLNCNRAPSAVVIPASLPKNALQLQQLVLTHLPQGPGAAVPSSFKAVPAALFTLMLWTFDRCVARSNFPGSWQPGALSSCTHPVADWLAAGCQHALCVGLQQFAECSCVARAAC
jgi:hypothetical protein